MNFDKKKVSLIYKIEFHFQGKEENENNLFFSAITYVYVILKLNKRSIFE